MLRRWSGLAICLIASDAIAEGAGVLVLDGDRAVGQAIVKAIGAERAHVTDAPIAQARAALAAGAMPIPRLARMRGVRDQILEGWRAYLQVSIEFAASRLATARTEAEALVPYLGGAELYADASLRLGAVLAHEGRVEESQTIYRLALALDPDRAITTAEFSPDIVDGIEAARLVRPPSQRVHLAITPPEAELAIDGLPMSKGARELDLARGQHLVVARAPGYEPLGQAINVDDTHSTFSLALEEDPAVQRLARPEGELAPYVDTLMTFAELDEMVIVEPIFARGGRALVVQRCVGIPAKCSASIEVGYPDDGGLEAAAREAWSTIRVGDLRYPPLRRGESPGGPKPPERSWYRNPWVWGGVAATAIAAGVIMVVAFSGSTPSPTVVIDPGDYTR